MTHSRDFRRYLKSQDVDSTSNFQELSSKLERDFGIFERTEPVRGMVTQFSGSLAGWRRDARRAATRHPQRPRRARAAPIIRFDQIENLVLR